MKILHICTWDTDSGAAIAAMRHMEAMRYAGYDSKMLVLLKNSGDANVFSAVDNKWLQLIRRSYYGRRNSSKFEFWNPYADWSYSCFGFDISNHPKVKEADTVILHWVNSNFLSIKGIGNLISRHPNVYWFLHDMWPMTGGCHYALGCEKFKARCQKCPMFNNRSGSDKIKDASYLQFQEKLDNWVARGDIKVLAPSKWLCDEARASKVFANRECRILRNPVPVNIFKPLDKELARKALNLPLDKGLILFGAASATNAYKGWRYLSQALSNMYSSSNGCVVFGNNTNDISIYNTSLPVYPVGKFRDSISLSMLYSAADVFVTPSIADNYPNVLIEAMACGTPCIGFNIGGIPEIINDKVSGIVVNDVSSDSLASAIQSFFEERKESYSIEAYNQIRQNNSYEALRENYNSIFGETLG